MIVNTTPPMYQETNVYCENWTAEDFAQLFDFLKENKGIKLTLSFENEEKAPVVSPNSEFGPYLTRLGIGRHLNGYTYLKTGIRHCLDAPHELESITKLLYPAIAKEHQTTAGRVEHGIRHAISLAWEERNPEEWEKVFGYRARLRENRPTNTEFLAAISDYILLEKGV